MTDTFDPPFIPFRYRVDFTEVQPADADGEGGSETDISLCGGAFSEVSGLEANMEPKVIRQGGAYDGELQRPGQITYATVILKRGITANRHLWQWFRLMAERKTAVRLRATLVQLDVDREEGEDGQPRFVQVERLRWVMENALPTKFKAATFSGTAAEVGIEELHFVHERLSVLPGQGGGAP